MKWVTKGTRNHWTVRRIIHIQTKWLALLSLTMFLASEYKKKKKKKKKKNGDSFCKSYLESRRALRSTCQCRFTSGNYICIWIWKVFFSGGGEGAWGFPESNFQLLMKYHIRQKTDSEDSIIKKTFWKFPMHYANTTFDFLGIPL